MINSPKINEESVRTLAHTFWEEEGRPEGRAEAHWLRAIAAVTVPSLETPAVAPKPAKKAKSKR